jgi:hypothetical protein
MLIGKECQKSGLRARIGAAAHRANFARPRLQRNRNLRGEIPDESRVYTNGRHTPEAKTQGRCGVGSLVIKVPDDFHVITNEADRDDDNSGHPFSRCRCDCVIDVGL